MYTSGSTFIKKIKPLDSLAKWLSVRLKTKWLWVQISLLVLKRQIWRLLQEGAP